MQYFERGWGVKLSYSEKWVANAKKMLIWGTKLGCKVGLGKKLEKGSGVHLQPPPPTPTNSHRDLASLLVYITALVTECHYSRVA